MRIRRSIVSTVVLACTLSTVGLGLGPGPVSSAVAGASTGAPSSLQG